MIVPDRWQELEQLLDAALDLPPERREAFVGDACGSNDALERDLRSFRAVVPLDD